MTKNFLKLMIDIKPQIQKTQGKKIEAHGQIIFESLTTKHKQEVLKATEKWHLTYKGRDKNNGFPSETL